MEITDVRIRKLFSGGPMKAIVSVTFDGEFAVHDIKIISAADRCFIVMPSKKGADGSNRDICHPIVSSFREELEARVMDAYKIAVETDAGAGDKNIDIIEQDSFGDSREIDVNG